MQVQDDLQSRWWKLEAKLMERFNKKPDMEAILFLIGIQELGNFQPKFTKEQKQDLMHVAEFGVVMMLFIIGLELEPNLLWRMRKLVVGLGGLQFLITSTLIGLIAFSLGQSWQASLAIGTILSLSSTAIVMQSLREKELMRTAAGQSSFSVLLFQDIAEHRDTYANIRITHDRRAETVDAAAVADLLMTVPVTDEPAIAVVALPRSKHCLV